VPSISPRLSLFVPNDDTLFVTEDIAANWESIDEKVVGFLTDVAASRPAASSANEGFVFYATDTQGITFSNGTAWVPTLALSGDGPITYDANTGVIGWAGTTDDVPEGANNLYYTDERADARIAAAELGDLANVDEGSGGANADDLLTYDGSDWVPTADITVDSVQFDVAAGIEDPAEGLLAWDAEDGTLALGLTGGQVLQVGEETLFRVKNQTGSTILNGTAVGFAGTLGASGVLLAAPFIADGSQPSTNFMGVASQDIADGDDGYVTHFGKVRGLNLSAFDDGDILYVSATVAGALTATAPVAPNNIIQVAAVIKAGSPGSLLVRPTLGSNLFNDEAVGATESTIADGDMLVWDEDAGVFVSEQPVRALGDLEDVDEGSGAESGSILTYDGSFWVPQTLPPTPAPELYPVAHSAISIEEDYQFFNNYNGISVSPTSIADGVEVVVPEGASWEISPWAVERPQSAPLYLTENRVTSSYTLGLEDTAKVVAFDSSSDLTLNVPSHQQVAFPVGTVINVYRNGDGEVSISSKFPGTLDATFVNPNLVGGARTIAVQPDGKILIGGWFASVGGQTRNRVARLNADGTLDTTFVDPIVSSDVEDLVLQPDGKILIVGLFTSVGGQTRNRVARLNSDGTLDETFNPNANSTVFSIALQPDGKILIGGQFTSLAGLTRQRIARLNPDGTFDTTFSISTPNNAVQAIALQPDGKILIGGQFSAVGGVTRSRVARLNSNGTLDTTFGNPNANSTVFSIALQSDGKILIVGLFTSVGGQTRNRVARLNSDGTLDTTFVDPNVSSTVRTIVLEPDGKILIGGVFASVGGQTRNRVARLNSDGTLDTTFVDPQISGGSSLEVRDISLYSQDKVVIVGFFSSVAGTTMGSAALLTGGDEVIVRNAGFIAEQYGEVSLRKRAENEWVLAGNVA
jgi:uncharacterized delta-60 repeat protein